MQFGYTENATHFNLTYLTGENDHSVFPGMYSKKLEHKFNRVSKVKYESICVKHGKKKKNKNRLPIGSHANLSQWLMDWKRDNLPVQ